MNPPAITLNQVSKSFTIRTDNPRSVKTLLTRWSQFNFSTGESKTVEILHDVSFTIRQGEFVGIMGRNGAGKSTILKLITGIYKPNAGTLDVHGRIAPLLELGAGFVDELSGLENIYLNSAILGYSRHQTQERIQTIIEFAELGDWIQHPIRTYSSGMLVRLGFSIAAHLDTPILLFDEIFAVGDAYFQKKCQDRILQLHREGRTIVIVTHTAREVADHCDRCIVLADKSVLFDGPAKAGVDVYLKGFHS